MIRVKNCSRFSEESKLVGRIRMYTVYAIAFFVSINTQHLLTLTNFTKININFDYNHGMIWAKMRRLKAKIVFFSIT